MTLQNTLLNKIIAQRNDSPHAESIAVANGLNAMLSTLRDESRQNNIPDEVMRKTLETLQATVAEVLSG